MANSKVREKIANLKPGPEGLKIAWDRLKKEYGQTQTVINTHIEEIVNLPVLRSHSFQKVLDFYEKLGETKNIMTVNGTKKQALPIYKIVVKSVDNKASEEIEVTGANLKDFTTITRPDLRELKTKYEHTRDKAYYKTYLRKYTIQLILGDKFYSKIKTKDIFKGKPEDPIVEGTTFGWVIHGGDFPDNQCMFTRETR